MQTFSTNPGKALSTRTGKITAALTVFALALFSTVSYIQSRPEIPTNSCCLLCPRAAMAKLL